MKITYDKTADAMYVYLQSFKKPIKVFQTKELGNGFIVDFDKKGRPLGIEILGVAQMFRDRGIKNVARHLKSGIGLKISSGFTVV